MVKFDYQEIMKLDLEGARLISNNSEEIDTIVNLGKLSQIAEVQAIHSILISKFQVFGKVGFSFALNHYLGSFTAVEGEGIEALSAACLRKLNREREMD